MKSLITCSLINDTVGNSYYICSIKWQDDSELGTGKAAEGKDSKVSPSVR
jgi:hypothetical protein